ncbi:MAG: ABC transporter ATP-binding protein [Chloroflexi bacterium]|nr:ABC transporter ATP-binding protein [Chloroflexota bacterium]
MLELRAVTKKYGHKTALNALSLDIQPAEFVVIFGPAGAGKSTTLNLIAGITDPTSGEIMLNGHPMNRVAPENRNMSMVFENYALYSHLSVFENLAFPLRARGMGTPEVKQKVAEIATILQITPFLERKPGFLSGGQRQRVALGRALVRDADVYLLDEPISHLDAKLRHRMRGELKALCQRKEAIVVHVTHDYREAMSLSHRMVVINKGHLMQFGTPDEIYHTPANEFVASFVGEPPMSFIDTRYAQYQGRVALLVSGTETQPVHLPVNGQAAEFLGRAQPKTLRVGVRASDISIERSASAKHDIPAEVYVVETLGHRDIITVKIGAHLVKVVAAPGMNLHVKDTVWVNIGPETYHLFGDEKAIAHPTGKRKPAPVAAPEGV